jgi:putative intracellular protease/amidase
MRFLFPVKEVAAMKKILMVLTSHDSLGNTDEKTGIWIEEFTSPYYRFVDNGMDVTLVSPAGGEPPIDPKSSLPGMQTDSTKRFNKDPMTQEAFKNTLPLSKVNGKEYDALFFPGGHGPMWDLSSDPATARIVSEFHKAGKPIGAVCHGPAALIQATDDKGVSILKGRKVTGFSNTEEVAVGLAKVVIDDLLVTGQNPASAEDAAGALISLLTRKN